RFRVQIAAFATGALSCIALPVFADGTPFFSTAQIGQGRYEYAQKCSVCHGTQSEGGGAPALKGPTFIVQWRGKTLKEFYGYVHDNMPLGESGSLDGQVYADIVAFLLAQSGVAAGNQKFTPATPMERVLDFGGAIPGGAVASTGSTQVKIGALYGKLAQPSTSNPTQAELDAADGATTNWMMYNKGYRAERYSSLDRINTFNAGRLRPICMFQLGELGTFSTGPVVYDGILYATTHLGTYAIDATTCKRLWAHQHDPQGPE